MADPQPPTRSTVIHNTITGGQQAMASENVSFVQYNGTTDPAQRLDELLRILKERVSDFDDPARADREVATIEAVRAARQQDRQPVLTSLETLAALATVGGVLSDTIGRAIDLVSQHWPL
ncbi:hypothetical protein [Micromonospora sp. 067-2]|uniref:hypothetical protein n=1 Tax=Micromonospora sp. 067-2 TaxID=2789270 RepID=UPI00397B7B6C